LQGLSEEVVNLNVLKSAGLIRKTTRYVKIMLSGTLVRAMTVTGEGISISKGARDAIATAGGKVEV
jgi:large subunit ribosomal protein L15